MQISTDMLSEGMSLEQWTKPLTGAFHHVLRLRGVSVWQRMMLGVYKIMSVIGYVSGLQRGAEMFSDEKQTESADFRYCTENSKHFRKISETAA